MSVLIEPAGLAAQIDAAFDRLVQAHFADALWTRTLTVWTPDPAVQRQIANRLGWLGAIEFLTPALDRLRGFADSIRRDGFTDVVLLGMGGSSLAPEVMRQILGVSAGFPRFRMLDSVEPSAVRDAMADASTSLFVLASKSGTTIEPNVLAAEARRRLELSGHRSWGSRFVAITDENTALHQRARADGFREVFLNAPDIGGRYSALSFFGMVPAALMGADLARLVDGARAMADACRIVDPRLNPGLALGAVMAAAAEAGRDKLTIAAPERLASFGLWVEQLIAESTGKQGRGIVPIAGETADARYGRDRAAVAIALGADAPDALAVDRLRTSGAPLVSLQLADPNALGAEFLRWEVATATAGWLLGINPFDEPNVQQAKDATRTLLETYAVERSLPSPDPHASLDGVRLALTGAAQERLGAPAVAEFLRVLGPDDYFALLAYVSPADSAFGEACRGLRDEVARRTGCATMFGYGPRYLHSTGQLHKGGANNGVFIVIAAEPVEDLPVPDQPYSFGVLTRAQAFGDFASLDRSGRRALLVQLPHPTAALLQTLAASWLAAI